MPAMTTEVRMASDGADQEIGVMVKKETPRASKAIGVIKRRIDEVRSQRFVCRADRLARDVRRGLQRRDRNTFGEAAQNPQELVLG